MNYMIDAATHTTLQNEKEKRERKQNDICQSHTLNTCRIKHATFTRFHNYHHTHPINKLRNTTRNLTKEEKKKKRI